MGRRILAIVKKEFYHIFRDWQTLMIILLMPVIMMFLYGYALNMDFKEVEVSVEQPVSSYESNQIVKAIDASNLFRVIRTERVIPEPSKHFIKYKTKAIFRIPPNFASDLRNGGSPAVIQVLIDGTDPTLGTILRNASEGMLVNASLKIMHIDPPTIVNVHKKVLYNEQQVSSLYFVPGLMALILLMVSALLTSLTITREKELGTLENLLISPLKPHEIIIGKIIPYIFLAAADGFIILLVGRFSFNIEIAGNIWLLALASFIYVFTALSIGLLISTIASNQTQAMMIVLPAIMLPTIILSGFIFPITSLPLVLQWLTNVIPATHYLTVIRAIIIKGSPFIYIWQPMLILNLIGLALLIIAIKKFRTTI